MLTSIVDVSSTPPGSPPSKTLASLGLQQQVKQVAPVSSSGPVPAAPQPDASSILAALAGLQPMPAAAVAAPVALPAAVPAPSTNHASPHPNADLASLLAGISQPQRVAPPTIPPPSLPTQAHGQQQFGQPYQAPTPVNVHVPPPQNYSGYYQAPAPAQPVPQPSAQQNPLGALASLLPPHVISNPGLLTQVLTLLQGFQQEGIPQEQWGAVIAALYPAPQDNNTSAATSNSRGGAANESYPRSDAHGSYRDRSRDRGRARSRSPDSRAPKSANRRPSPVYGTYDALVANSQGEDPSSQYSSKAGRGRGGRTYRQRTPPMARSEHQDMPAAAAVPGPKWTEIDPTMPAGHIKVLSRTLFVGGATGSEAELRAIFSGFGQVQTCIANVDKRHAFVKMATRADAVSAKTAMETMRDPYVLGKARQTKWGVGFGPRECCDYATGISVIPIDTLTDADHKWMVSAEFGGTGGRPIESGLVVEEPDIEIGAGVSSKGASQTWSTKVNLHADIELAMSRRVGPDNAPRRGRGGGGGGGGRFRQPEPARQSPRPDSVNVAPPPAVPGFGFNFAMPGMPPY